MARYQNKGEVVVEAPQDWLVRWDANDKTKLGYLTDEATNDIDSWTSDEGPEGIGAIELIAVSVDTNYPEWILDADGYPCVHFQNDGSLWRNTLTSYNAAFHARTDDATNTTVFVVGTMNDISKSSNQYILHGSCGIRMGNIGLDKNVDLYFGAVTTTSTNDLADRKMVLSCRNKHNGTDDNDADAWFGYDNDYSADGVTDANMAGPNLFGLGSYSGGSNAIWDADCNVYEVLVYGRALTDGEHAAVVDYLSAKWGANTGDNATDVITEPLNTFPQDYWERWDTTTSSGMNFVTDEVTGDVSLWVGEKGQTFLDSSHAGTIDPIWTPGKVTFDGSGDAGFRTPVYTGVFSGNPRAVFSAGRINDASPTNGSLFAGPVAYIRFEDLNGNSNFAYNDGSAINNNSVNDLLDTPLAVGYSTDMTDINWWWGGNSKSTAVVTGGTFNESLANFYVGMANASATTTMDGELYEVIVYDRHVTDAEAEQILAYLSAKWQCQNEDSASSVIADYDNLGHSWVSDGPDPQGLQLESFTPVNYTASPLRNADAPRLTGSDVNFDDQRFPASLPNLQTWYRSDHTGGMTFETGDAVSGGTISEFTDITGTRTMTKATAGTTNFPTFHPSGAVKGGFPSIEGGDNTTNAGVEASAPAANTTDTQQRLFWSVGTFGDATTDSAYASCMGNILFGGTTSAMSTDMVAKPVIMYLGSATTGINYLIANGGTPADNGDIHIVVYRVTVNGTNGDVESWYSGLKLPDRVSSSADSGSIGQAIGLLSTGNFDANGAQFLELGCAYETTSSIQTYTDQNVEDLIQYLCARYKVDYMPENTPITIGCWSRQTASNAVTDTCLWHDPSTMSPTSWALHPNVAQYHTTPANFAMSPPTGAVEMEKRTSTLGKPSLRSTEGMNQHMESDTAYTSTETTDFPADTLGMSTFIVCNIDSSTVAASGARCGNTISQLRRLSTTTIQNYGGSSSVNWGTSTDKWIIMGNSFAYDDDGTGAEGYPGSTDADPACYFYLNDETMQVLDTASNTSFNVENWVNWDIADGVANVSEIVTFKHPMTIEEINELKKYFQYKYNYAFDT